MSRPQTPHSITPRGSYVNLLEGRDREEQAMFSPSKIEKERSRAEAEVNASLLREKDDSKKKEEVVAAVASPGTSLSVSSLLWGYMERFKRYELMSSASDHQLLPGIDHDDRREQIRGLGISIHNDLPTYVHLVH